MKTGKINNPKNLSLIAIIIALISFCLPLLKGHIDVNDVNMVIASFGVLTAVLIGWQIYKTVNMGEEVQKIKTELQREIEIVKDFNKPPYMDVIIEKPGSKGRKILDEFSCKVFDLVNEDKGVRVLDLHTFIKVFFPKDFDIKRISSSMGELKEQYKDKIKFDYYVIEE